MRTRGTEEEEVEVGSCRCADNDRTEDAELSPNEEWDEFNKSLTELLMDDDDAWW